MKAIEAQLEKMEDTQISLTDPDARSLQGTGKETGTVGYNVQCALETEHHLIVAHEVTNAAHDRHQLSTHGRAGQRSPWRRSHRGHRRSRLYDGKEILACGQGGVTAYVPRFSTSNAKAEGRFGKQDFVYRADEDVYLCPAGERLTYHYTNEEDGKVLRRYWTTACGQCPLKEKCTTGKERRITRWEHEAVLEAAQDRLDNKPDSAAFATHQNWPTFLVGLAASIGAGISMGFAEALSDDGSRLGSEAVHWLLLRWYWRRP